MTPKEKAIGEIEELFHEIYSGMEYPKVSIKIVEYFVGRALNNYENEKEKEIEIIRNNWKKIVKKACNGNPERLEWAKRNDYI